MSHGPIEMEVEVQMEAIGHVLHENMPEGYGFALLMFKHGDVEGGRMNYLSDASREDMISALKELLANFEGRGHAPHKTKQ